MTVLYGSSVADTTLTTACQMATTSGGVETSKATVLASGSGNFGEVRSLGSGSGAAVTAIPATPTGRGWVYYPGAGTFALGSWAPVITMAVTVNNAGNQTLRIFKLSGGVYTSIGTITFVATTTAKTTYTPTPVSMPATSFASGDGLYFDLWYQDNTGAASDTATVYESTTAAAGVTNDFQVTTSTWQPASYEDLGTRFLLQPPNAEDQAARMRFQAPTALTLYGLETATGTLATACKLVPIIGGTSASLTTKVGTVQGSGELFSLGSTATFPGTTVPSTAGVHGYLWDVTTLEATTVAAGTWTVKVNLNWNSTYTTMTSTITARVWKRSSGGVYTQIGSAMTLAGPGASTTTKTLFTLTGSSFPSMTFLAGDKLYLDVWLTVTSTGGATTRTIALWASSSATAGIAGQVEIGTPGYTPLPAPSQSQKTRLRLSVQGVKDLAARMLLGALTIGNQATRLLLQTSGTTALKDSALRLRLSALTLTDVALRLRLLSIQKSNLAFRLRILAVVLSNVAIRLVLAGATAALKNTAARVRLLASHLQNAATRLHLLAAAAKDSASRLHLGGGVGYRNTVINDNPRAYYRLDTVSGTTVPDESGNGYTATLIGATTLAQPGAVASDADTATLFTTGTASLVLPPALNPNAWSALSLEYWIKLSGAWQHVVLTTDDATTTLYLNGAVYVPTDGDPVVIDILAYAGSYLPGSLDEVALYTYPLTPEQVRTHFTLGIQDSQEYAPRSFGGSYLTSTLFSLPRSFGSALAFGWGNLAHVAARLVLAGGTATQKDLAARLSLLAGSTINLGVRLRLLAVGLRDVPTRLRVSVTRLLDQALRLPLLAPRIRDQALRLLLLALTLTGLSTRLRLLSIRFQDEATRTRLLSASGKDQDSRLRLLAQRVRDSALRFLLSAVQQADQAARVRLQENLHYFPRAFGGDYSVDVPYPQPRSFGSALLYLWASFLDAPTRLLLGATKLGDQATRLRLLIGINKDLSTRLLLRAVRLADVVTRVRLLAVSMRDQASRTRLIAQHLQDTATRVLLRALQQVNLATRLRLAAVTARDLSSRLRLAAVAARDFPARLVLHVVGLATGNLNTRILLLAVRLRDTSARARIQALRSLDQASRARLLASALPNAVARLRLQVLQIQGIAARLRLLVATKRDLAARLALALSSATPLRDVSYRLCLYDGAFTLVLASRDGALVASTRGSLSSVFSRDGASRIPTR